MNKSWIISPKNKSFVRSNCDHDISQFCTYCSPCCICNTRCPRNEFARVELNLHLCIHLKCATCPGCNKTRSLTVNDDKSVRISCGCRGCDECGDCLHDVCIFIKVDGCLKKYHRRCSVKADCQLCGLPSSIEDAFIPGGNKYFHESCAKGLCSICYGNVPVKDQVKLEGYQGLFHRVCFESRKCTVCGIKADFSMITKNGKTFSHHEGVCKAGECEICKKTINLSKNKEIEGRLYHADCLESMKCYLCQVSLKMSNILTCDAAGIRHLGCNPDPCHKCASPLTNQSKEWEGRKWHLKCIPSCRICGKNDPDKLEILPNGEIKHSGCITDLCIICIKPIGRSAWQRIQEIYKAHIFCVKQCHCGNPMLDPMTFPKVHLELNNDLKLSVRMKRLLLAFTLANKKSKALSRDMVRMISTMIINFDTETSICVAKRHGIDFNKICTSNRCASKDLSKSKCPKCCSTISFCYLDSTSCHQNSCSMVREFARTIWEKCFQDYTTEVVNFIDTAIVFQTVGKFKEMQKKMTSEQLILYAANMTSINAIMLKI